MNIELPEGWTLSEPTQIFHAEWFQTYFKGRPMSLVVIHDHCGKWWAQNTSLQLDSAAEVIRATLKRLGITMD